MTSSFCTAASIQPSSSSIRTSREGNIAYAGVIISAKIVVSSSWPAHGIFIRFCIASSEKRKSGLFQLKLLLSVDVRGGGIEPCDAKIIFFKCQWIGQNTVMVSLQSRPAPYNLWVFSQLWLGWSRKRNVISEKIL